jgi:hypothetical protein
MPIALALFASALIHAVALVAPGWDLPGINDTESASTIDAVLVKPAARPEPIPVARPAAPKPHVDKPRVVSAPEAVAPATGPLPSASRAVPVETPPVAVPSAPTIEPAAPQPVRISLPGKGRVRYTITRGDGGFVIGQSVHTWEHDGFTYKLQSVTETTGLAAIFKPARVVQSSQGEVTTEGLKPREFRHERVGGLDTASFDWARRVVAYAGREGSIAAGTQDMLSMYYQLVLLAPKGDSLDMPIATGRKLESYRFEVLGEEAVGLASGERRAWHLKTRSGNDTIEVWLGVGKGADMRGLPLKIRFTDRKGEIFDQLADEIDIQETQ